jgi:solute carrier family 29 (equilibrative nucleoside transporter), member 1/2/3
MFCTLLCDAKNGENMIILRIIDCLFYSYIKIKVYFKYHKQIAQENSRQNNMVQDVIPYFYIIKKIWYLLLCIWLTLFSTLAIFPVYQLSVKPSGGSFFISDFWFTDITCFLTFNVSITIGNTLTACIRKPGPKWIVIPVVLKAVLSMGFFLVCNSQSDQRNFIPVLVNNDYIYWTGCILTPLVTGYLISLLMMYTPR